MNPVIPLGFESMLKIRRFDTWYHNWYHGRTILGKSNTHYIHNHIG